VSPADPIFAPISQAEHVEAAGGVRIDMIPAGIGRVKRVTYPAGFRWSEHMKPLVGTNLCMHAHVGFIAHGAIGIRYGDGCTVQFRAPQFVVIDPGHEGWVEGNEIAVLIEFDFGAETVNRLGLPESHRHAA
jgi:hypothetical protein